MAFINLGIYMESSINNLIRDFYSDNGIKRARARFELLQIGKPIIDFFIGLQYVPIHQVRWEAVKTLSQLAVPEAIPILINALENEDMDVRWLAAHGLVQIGKPSIPAVLEALEGNQNSKYLREGAHHILRELQHKHLFSDELGLIKMLGHYGSQYIIADTAKKILAEKNSIDPLIRTE